MIDRIRHTGMIVVCLALIAACTIDVATADDDFSRLKLSRAGAGTSLPAFALGTIEGKTIEFSKLRGKVVVLNFWATWCGPCKEEMPALDRLRRRFDPRDVAILTITTEHEQKSIQQFMKQLDSSLPVLLDEQRDVSLAFMVRGLPTTVFIAKNGTVVGRSGRANGMVPMPCGSLSACVRTLHEDVCPPTGAVLRAAVCHRRICRRRMPLVAGPTTSKPIGSPPAAASSAE